MGLQHMFSFSHVWCISLQSTHIAFWTGQVYLSRESDKHWCTVNSRQKLVTDVALHWSRRPSQVQKTKKKAHSVLWMCQQTTLSSSEYDFEVWMNQDWTTLQCFKSQLIDAQKLHPDVMLAQQIAKLYLMKKPSHPLISDQSLPSRKSAIESHVSISIFSALMYALQPSRTTSTTKHVECTFIHLHCLSDSIYSPQNTIPCHKALQTDATLVQIVHISLHVNWGSRSNLNFEYLTHVRNNWPSTRRKYYK